MPNVRWDETWHRLREWTSGQAPSERLAAQILLADGYSGLDPSHPLGGRDGGKDAIATKDGKRWIMAAYFPRGQQSWTAIVEKFDGDVAGVANNGADGIAFVTNQELTLSERRDLCARAGAALVELYHLERITTLLDSVALRSTRKQFLNIDFEESDSAQLISSLRDDMQRAQRRLEGLQTGGDSFCYLMLYNFDMVGSRAKELVIIRKGEYPVYELHVRICDLDAHRDVREGPWGEVNAPAAFQHVKWALPASANYRVFFSARNGAWHQDLQLRRSEKAACWLAATRVIGKNGRDELFRHVDGGFEEEFGPPSWRP